MAPPRLGPWGPAALSWPPRRAASGARTPATGPGALYFFYCICHGTNLPAAHSSAGCSGCSWGPGEDPGVGDRVLPLQSRPRGEGWEQAGPARRREPAGLLAAGPRSRWGGEAAASPIPGWALP